MPTNQHDLPLLASLTTFPTSSFSSCSLGSLPLQGSLLAASRKQNSSASDLFSHILIFIHFSVSKSSFHKGSLYFIWFLRSYLKISYLLSFLLSVGFITIQTPWQYKLRSSLFPNLASIFGQNSCCQSAIKVQSTRLRSARRNRGSQYTSMNKSR